VCFSNENVIIIPDNYGNVLIINNLNYEFMEKMILKVIDLDLELLLIYKIVKNPSQKQLNLIEAKQLKLNKLYFQLNVALDK
jgi:hypothetical protein